MSMKAAFRRVFEKSGYTIHKVPPAGGAAGDGFYDEDGLRSVHNHDFMDDPQFAKAYQRGVKAGGSDYHWHWRVHIGLWAAYSASLVPGDFVECGVNYGVLSSAIMEYLDWNKQNRKFYLLDTFYGLDERYIDESERAQGIMENNKGDMYLKNVEAIRANFSEWKNVEIVPGAVPETLPLVKSEKIAYLHIDMNCSPPEVAALEYFWDRLTPGAFILFDDYAYAGHVVQKRAIDEVAARKNAKVVALPTGQGLIVKHPG